jgi:hypothetical protein
MQWYMGHQPKESSSSLTACVNKCAARDATCHQANTFGILSTPISSISTHSMSGLSSDLRTRCERPRDPRTKHANKLVPTPGHCIQVCRMASRCLRPLIGADTMPAKTRRVLGSGTVSWPQVKQPHGGGLPLAICAISPHHRSSTKDYTLSPAGACACRIFYDRIALAETEFRPPCWRNLITGIFTRQLR